MQAGSAMQEGRIDGTAVALKSLAAGNAGSGFFACRTRIAMREALPVFG